MKQEKKTHRPLRIGVKLLLVLIPLLIAFIWVLTALNSGYIMSSTQSALEMTLRETAQITAEHISESILYNKKLTTLLAARVGAMYENELTMPYEELDVDKFAAELSEMGVEYGFLHMMAAGPDGCTRTQVHTDLRAVNADYYIAIADKGESSYVSDVSEDKGSFIGKNVLNYSAPIKNAEGEIIGVLVCKADAAELSALVKNISAGAGGSTFIMDGKGQCIAHTNPELLFSGDDYLVYKDNEQFETLNSLWDTMIVQTEGCMPYDFNGSRLAAFARIMGTNNWSIAVTVAQSEFTGAAIEARNASTYVGLALILLFAAIMIGLFVYAARPIKEITLRLEGLSQGLLKAPVTVDRHFDETFRLSQAASGLQRVLGTMISEIQYLLSQIADGNLTVSPVGEYPGDFYKIREAIENNLSRLNEIIQRISRTSEEVARGSSQMASGASGLAQGASEQASSLEELFETVTTLAQRTAEIGSANKKALVLTEEDNAEGEDLNEVTERSINAAQTLSEKLIIAIARIAEATGSIRRIASDIESISAETGMLALNASVEATHAGDAGRGFSVIASEIHNLSDKSRDAVKNTDAKIDSITRAVTRGTQLVDVTVSTIGEMTAAMEQVKGALEQISNVVENIAATAEETAAGSEELSAQAEVLRNLVSEFKYHTEEDIQAVKSTEV